MLILQVGRLRFSGHGEKQCLFVQFIRLRNDLTWFG